MLVDDMLGYGRLEYLDYNEKIYMLDDINRKKYFIYLKCFQINDFRLVLFFEN